ncbi:LytTR family DNA-binding domain-containing protein [Leucobacter chironomi]|uniref:LytTR family DNA-binding domain-containing protein n=1 Tax=Leucobacter chironomi TaxID=491918 RepID=UPI0004000FB6|nr:LytTR family DNA-binding domain-containing protein [Leucobacter chironomi]
MVRLVCSPELAQRLTRELALAGVPVAATGGDHAPPLPGAAAEWALVERGFEAPAGAPAILFDPLDYMEAVRMIAAGLPAGPPRVITGHSSGHGSRGALSVLAPRDVHYFEAAGDAIFACTANGRFRVRETLQHYENGWSALGFVRINRSQIVNLLHVREIVPWFNSRLVLRMAGGGELEASKIYAKRLRAAVRM